MAKEKLFVALAAEKLLAAEKGERKIAVEIKSFVGKSDTNDLEDAVGQYVLYESLLEETNSDRTLYLAIHNIAFEAVFVKSFGAVLLKKGTIRLLVFDSRKEEILQWIP